MMSKWLAALLSSVFICQIAAYLDYTPIGARESGISYISLFRLFFVGWIIIFPIYMLIGIPISLLNDLVINRLFYEAPKGVALIMKPISYMLASVAVGWLFSLFTGVGGWNTYKYPFMMGALIFWVFQELLRWIGKRLKRAKRHSTSV